MIGADTYWTVSVALYNALDAAPGTDTRVDAFVVDACEAIDEAKHEPAETSNADARRWIQEVAESATKLAELLEHERARGMLDAEIATRRQAWIVKVKRQSFGRLRKALVSPLRQLAEAASKVAEEPSLKPAVARDFRKHSLAYQIDRLFREVLKEHPARTYKGRGNAAADSRYVACVRIALIHAFGDAPADLAPICGPAEVRGVIIK